MHGRVIVVGGGLAGIAAASALGERGFEVMLLESRPRWGGRASSFVDQATGKLIDNCQHVNLGCGTNFQHFCRTLGIDSQFVRERGLTFVGPDGRLSKFAAAPLPAPLHLFPALLGLRYLSLGEKCQLARGLRQLARRGAGEESDESFLQWLERHGQSPQVIERFWHVVLVSALSETLDRIDIAHARKVFVDAFLANRHGWEVWLATVPLDELYGERLDRWFAAHHVLPRLQSGVKGVVVAGGTTPRATGVELRSGERLDAEHVILAVPQNVVLSLLPDEWQAHPQLSGIGRLQTAPISSVHLWFDRPITDLRHAVFVGRLSQWLFNRSAIQRGTENAAIGEANKASPAPTSHSLRRGGKLESDLFYYQVVISASRDALALGQEQAIAAVVDELAAVWPAVREARLVHSRLVTEHKAVVSMLPGVERLRPAQQSPIGNVQLAGDWTQTGWPGTMEGAVRSGYLAAGNVLSQSGQPERLVQADLGVALLSKLSFGL